MESDDEILDENSTTNENKENSDLSVEKAPSKEESDAKKELLYLRAEFENYKKRMQRDRNEAIRFANERLLHEIVPIVDYLDRALSHADSLKKSKQPDGVKEFVDGIEMTRTEFLKVLEKFGLSFVGQAGEVFDPVKHEAISQVDVEPGKENTVVEVFKKGCLLEGRLISPAKVIVGRLKDSN